MNNKPMKKKLHENFNVYCPNVDINVSARDRTRYMENYFWHQLESAEECLDPSEVPTINTAAMESQDMDFADWERLQSKIFPNFPQLPPHWIRLVSKSRGGVYYYNMETKISSQEAPGSKILGYVPKYKTVLGEALKRQKV